MFRASMGGRVVLLLWLVVLVVFSRLKAKWERGWALRPCASSVERRGSTPTPTARLRSTHPVEVSSRFHELELELIVTWKSVVVVHAVRSPSGSVDLDLDLDLGTEGVACVLVFVLSVWVMRGVSSIRFLTVRCG